jgi:hypothetical protein
MLPPKGPSSRRLRTEYTRRGRHGIDHQRSVVAMTATQSCWMISAHAPKPAAARTTPTAPPTSVEEPTRMPIERKSIARWRSAACVAPSEPTTKLSERTMKSGRTSGSP